MSVYKHGHWLEIVFTNSILTCLCYCIQIEMAPLSRSMDEDLDEAAEEVKVRIQIYITTC
jgi:hypothetical protein